MIAVSADDFRSWRERARSLLLGKAAPGDVLWSTEPTLFPSVTVEAHEALHLPRSFVTAAEKVALHSDPHRWSLLYRIAWRILFENRNLLAIETDGDVVGLNRMRKAVEHDTYKMRAFVRFRKVQIDGAERYIAWYTPDHDTLDANAEFFVERFRAMHWAILTPHKSLAWDTHELHRGPGVPRSQAPAEDELEELFRVYYSAIYNPARLNITAMTAQMPLRRWNNLPETQAIPALIRESRTRVEQMTAPLAEPASAFLPVTRTLPVLRAAVTKCRACELCARASGPVFGEGAASAKLVLVGEQPGEEEDRAGKPFVGPAGQILNQALEQAGLKRDELWVTNAVKSFRFEERGKRRIHQTPKAIHISTCRPWLEAELSALQPQFIACLGATAAQSVLGRSVAISKERGQLLPHARSKGAIVTYHPSAILRAPDEQLRRKWMSALVEDLAMARGLVQSG